ncbi:unnamed protein product, partial [Hapterophycus canaliculatus]
PLPSISCYAQILLVGRPAAFLPTEQFKGYMRQCREELTRRLCDRVYPDEGLRSKHWMLFSKRKFMGKEML